MAFLSNSQRATLTEKRVSSLLSYPRKNRPEGLSLGAEGGQKYGHDAGERKGAFSLATLRRHQHTSRPPSPSPPSPTRPLGILEKSTSRRPMASSQQNPNVKVYGPPSLPLLDLARFRLVELLLQLTLPCSRPAFRVLRAPANRAFVQGPSLLFACLRARWEGVVLQQGGWVVTQTAPDLFSFPRLWHFAGYPGLPEPDPTRDVRPRAVASGVRFKLSLPGMAGEPTRLC